MIDPHTEQLIATKVLRLEALELQLAYHGPLTPPHITMELADLRKEIATLRYQRTQLIFRTKHLDLEPPSLAPGLIVLVSPLRAGDSLAALGSYQAIDYHRGTLRHCWLIATDDSRATAEALARHFGAYQISCSIRM